MKICNKKNIFRIVVGTILLVSMTMNALAVNVDSNYDGFIDNYVSSQSTNMVTNAQTINAQALSGYNVLVVGVDAYRNYAAQRITALGGKVTEVDPSNLNQQFLDANDVLWVSLGSSSNAVLNSKTSLIRDWVAAGHGLIVEQPNVAGKIALLPYTFVISSASYSGECVRNVIDTTHPITNGVAPNDLPACYDTADPNIGPEWKILVKDGNNNPSLVVANYQKGKIIVELGNTHSSSSCVCGICQTDIAIERMIKWAKVESVPILQLDAATNKCEYGLGDDMSIIAKLSVPNGQYIFAAENSFSVKVDGFVQNGIKAVYKDNVQGQCGAMNGNYLITGLKVPNLVGSHTIEIGINTGIGKAVVTKNFVVNDYPVYKVLVILASPYDIMDNSPNKDRPSIIYPENSGTDWYNTLDETGTYYGSPEWYKKAANELHDYYWRISYNKGYIDTTVSDKWYRLPKKEKDYSPRTTQLWGGYTSDLFANGEKEYQDAKAIAKNDFNFKNFDVVVVVDPISSSDGRYGWNRISGLTFNGGTGLLIGTEYGAELPNKPFEDTVTTLAHELSHWKDIRKNGVATITTNHGDNIQDPWSVFSSFTIGEEPPFDPMNAKKLGFSDYSEVSIPTIQALDPIENGKDRSIHFKKTVPDLVIPIPFSGPVTITSKTFNYFLEFRANSWPKESTYQTPTLLIWRGLNSNWDDPDTTFGIHKVNDQVQDPSSKIIIKAKALSNTGVVLDIRDATDIFTIARKLDVSKYEINMTILSRFFEDSSFGFRVLDVGENEVYNGTISTDSNGNFVSGISFVDIKNGDIETYPYIIQMFDGEKWANFHMVYPTLLDGNTLRLPIFSASDVVEPTMGAGDLTKFNVFPGSLKVILETSAPVDPNIKYSIFMDTDNQSSTGFNINSIGADYKIEYVNSQVNLYKYNQDSTWSLLSSPYIVGASNGNSIEILMSTEIIQGMSDVIKLVAATHNNDQLVDIIPDSTSQTPYLLFANVDPVELKLSRHDYKQGEMVNVTGYGFYPNQVVPLSFMKDGHTTLWSGSVQANSNGFVIDENAFVIPTDFSGTAHMYWTGTETDSFTISKRADIVSQNYVTFNTQSPSIVGLGNKFSVKVDIENLGDDLSNVILKLNTSGKTSNPEIVPIGSLKKGDKYSYTWVLTSTLEGFASINEELSSDQENLLSDTIGLYVANLNVNINAPSNTTKDNGFNINVSAVNNQNDMIYTDLKMETSIKNTNINFSKSISSLSPGEIVDMSYPIDANAINIGKYQILTEIVKDNIVLSSIEKTINIVARQGGASMSIVPRSNNVTNGNSIDINIKAKNTQNVGDTFRVYLNVSELPATARADISWFNWTEKVINIRAGEEITIPIKISIPAGISGTKAFRARANSTTSTKVYAYDTGYVKIS